MGIKIGMIDHTILKQITTKKNRCDARIIEEAKNIISLFSMYQSTWVALAKENYKGETGAV